RTCCHGVQRSVLMKERAMRIQVLGTGCAKCKQLTANAEQAVRELGITAEVEKVEDIREIRKFNVMSTPALVIDGQVRSAGKVLPADAVKALLQ
ncbi:MAG TPA: thioredoxin family protein, partial [Gemmatimonadaceae bacterium]|nr:thioredoxin family protein [Gemmatimonadaceae bacterium]